jgi:hypothetical protein
MHIRNAVQDAYSILRAGMDVLWKLWPHFVRLRNCVMYVSEVIVITV